MNYIYIKIKNEAIKNMLSITDWRFPKTDKMYKKIFGIFKATYLMLMLSSFCLIFHLKDEELYLFIKGILKKNSSLKLEYREIFILFGNLEIVLSELRFYYYLIICIILLAFMYKRIKYGGKLLYNFKYSFILSIVSFIINIIMLLLSLIIAIFGFLCKITELDFRMKMSYSQTHTNIFYIHFALNILYSLYIIELCIQSGKLIKYLRKTKNDYNNLYKYEGNEESENQFIYIGKDFEHYILYEIQIEGFPRYLFYSLKPINIKEIQNERNNDNNKEISNNINTNRNIFEEEIKIKGDINNNIMDSKNNINNEEKITNI